jgi:N-acetylmuramic acid 6-phosphate etherase
VTLVDSIKKKIMVVEDIITQLNISNAEVVNGRAEEICVKEGFTKSYDYIIARAVAPTTDMIRWCVPFLREEKHDAELPKTSSRNLHYIPPGHMILLKGGHLGQEIEQAKIKTKPKFIQDYPITVNGVDPADTSDNNIFAQIKSLSTEQRNRRSLLIDLKNVNGILSIINKEDEAVARAVKKELPRVGKAVEVIVKSLKSGGRLIYAGAGTSGRLGILDATECPPTFGTNPAMIQGIIAGGKRAVFRSQEGAEDKKSDGAKDIRTKRVSGNDVVCGIAASMRTPYVIGALQEAKKRGAKTLFITTNPRRKLMKPMFTQLRQAIDVAICVEVGPEVIMGSTRMKSGTAQKMVLNMLTTASMIRLGKVYENMMVDLQMTSLKLVERAKRVIMIATGVDYSAASSALVKADCHVKTAIVMIKLGVSKSTAQAKLKKENGFVRRALMKGNHK